jgi:hypothetical protein
VHEIHDTAQATLPVEASELFALITDVDRLPEWNAAIECVLERPAAVGPGASWTVQMHPHKLVRWKSVSTLQTLDAAEMHFQYRTVNADGNPSHAIWNWEVRPGSEGATVSVRWDIWLRTLDRQLLAGPIRRHELRHEVPTSLRTIGELLAA